MINSLQFFHVDPQKHENFVKTCGEQEKTKAIDKNFAFIINSL